MGMSTVGDIRDRVIATIKHDTANQPLDAQGMPILDKDSLLSAGRGACGHRASLFQQWATEAGIESRIALYRGHIVNEVNQSGHWRTVNTSQPRHRFEQALYNHILRGPKIGTTTEWDYARRLQIPKTIPSGQYTQWLNSIQALDIHTMLPRDILDGKPLSNDRPNLVIRHDICDDIGAWMEMVHEENQLRLRSVTYVRVDGHAYSFDEHIDLWKMFEEQGFEIGLHLTAVDSHGILYEVGTQRLEEQLDRIRQHFDVRSIQAHGYSDERGVPFVTNYHLENMRDEGFQGILSSTGRYVGRLADSCGVMYPGDPVEWLKGLKPGSLHYALWHPQYYTVSGGWTRFDGTMANPHAPINTIIKSLNRRVKDTAYFDHVDHPHLLAVADYLRSKAKDGEWILDVAGGWGQLGVLLSKPSLKYTLTDSDFKRIKAAQALRTALHLPMADTRCLDLLKDSFPFRTDWVVLIGWEGDLHDLRGLDRASEYGHRMILSYINAEKFNAEWKDQLPHVHYRPLSETEFQEFLKRNHWTLEHRLTGVYTNGFPREVVVLKR